MDHFIGRHFFWENAKNERWVEITNFYFSMEIDKAKPLLSEYIEN